jgi:bis(5'-nucleosyl)-tetraphosphatase (symmetrical)
MATYAIGDIQGCYHTFQALLGRIRFSSTKDKLWLVGDIINRGKGSLEVLRWCYQKQENIRLVLGNHDLHALAVAHEVKPAHRGDTLQAIIDAPDSDDLLTWLRHQPLMQANDGYVMVHAGLLPQWRINEAFTYAQEVHAVLQGENYKDFLRNMYGNTPDIWHDNLVGMERLRIITNAMTRMRICTGAGELEFKFKGELKDIPDGYMPWFDVPSRKSQDVNIICGHWSALGLQQRENICALDTGCLWGGKLTAMCLETKAIIQMPADVKDKLLKI